MMRKTLTIFLSFILLLGSCNEINVDNQEKTSSEKVQQESINSEQEVVIDTPLTTKTHKLQVSLPFYENDKRFSKNKYDVQIEFPLEINIENDSSIIIQQSNMKKIGELGPVYNSSIDLLESNFNELNNAQKFYTNKEFTTNMEYHVRLIIYTDKHTDQSEESIKPEYFIHSYLIAVNKTETFEIYFFDENGSENPALTKAISSLEINQLNVLN